MLIICAVLRTTQMCTSLRSAQAVIVLQLLQQITSILSTFNDIHHLLSTEKDTNRVLERLSEINSGDSTPSVSTSTGEMSIMDGYVPNPTSLPDVSPIPPPTGDAVNNMTEATAAQSAQSAPTVINNITNNNTSGSQSSPVMVAPTTPRNATNSFIDFQKQQYTRI